MTEPLLLLSGRAETAEPAVADGVVRALSLNDNGRLRVASKQGQFAVITSDLAALNSALLVDVADASNVVLHVKNTGSAAMAAGAFIFEGSIDSTNGADGTWFGVQAVRSNANTIEGATGTLAMAAGAGLAYAWELSVNAVKWLRVRCTTAVTASSIARWTALRGSYATEPIPAVQGHGITGTVLVSPSTGVMTAHSQVVAASTNATVVKASSGGLMELTISNVAASPIFVKLYNKASAPTVGTDVPIVTIPVAAGATVAYDFGSSGKRFSTGIALAVTGASAATDTTVAAAGAQISASYL